MSVGIALWVAHICNDITLVLKELVTGTFT